MTQNIHLPGGVIFIECPCVQIPALSSTLKELVICLPKGIVWKENNKLDSL